MSATITHESRVAEQNKELGTWAVFKGRNAVRFLIASWPKVVQQFVGLSVFNTYATYFCKSRCRGFGRHCLTIRSSIRWQ